MRSGRLFVPEVVQTSEMDCGPACLKALLEGFGIAISYDRLRDVCHTDLDGTSIDTIEQVANELGLEAEQIMVPVDHLLLPEAKISPALVVVRLANSLTHFVVVWQQYGKFLQVMDPANGRTWPRNQAFLDQVYVHGQAVSAAEWREWAGSEEFAVTLRRRAQKVVSNETTSHLLHRALADANWLPIAALDAAIRMITPMEKSGGLGDSRTAGRVLEQFFERAGSRTENPFQVIPPAYWSVLPERGHGEDEQRLVFRGAVLLRVRGRLKTVHHTAHEGEKPSLASYVQETLSTPSVRPIRQLIDFMRADGLLAPAAVFSALAVSVCGVLFEALLYRTFLDLTRILGLPHQRHAAVAMLLGFLGALLFLELSITGGLMRLGRKLEVRVRTHLLHKIPRLPDRYLASRLISDMAERSHAIHEIRAVPAIGAQLIQRIFELTLTTAGIIWLDLHTIWPAVLSAVSAVALPIAIRPVVAERDLRFRTHSGALCRFYFDALRGLMPVRAHGANDAVRSEHESLLVTWVRAGIGLQRTAVALDALSLSIGFGLTIWLLLSHFATAGDSAVGLLLIYWALNLPAIGKQVAQIALQYPRQRNLALRLLEPLGAAEEEQTAEQTGHSRDPAESHVAVPQVDRGVSILFDGVIIRAMGHTILEEFSLRIEPGSHVCIVGPSGAGKSSFVGLLLGWHRPAAGQVFVDGHALEGACLQSLRPGTAWVDPTIQIWNRSLVENLQYGTSDDSLSRVGEVIEDADLLSLVEKLPEGLQTRLGESGALVSGGEGQRVRLGRAMLRRSPRLVVLDEPFSALDREQRHEYLRRVRQIWHKATLLCITHDVSESRHFERVLVMDQGHIVEDGAPADLIQRPESRFHQLLESERVVRERIWSNASWRRIRLQHGQLIESGTEDHEYRFEEALLADGAPGRGSDRVSSQISVSTEVR
jgi:ABC-type bacteriocin/lantibiotic exporter with double-glycine peptidase domain